MTTTKAKPDPPDEHADRAKATAEGAAHFFPGASREAQAYAELLSKGAEEIQDHLSLVARVQVQIGRLLETSIQELERAQRLETLTSLIAGSDANDDLGERDGGSEERPGVYLEHEIKSLKKMQKLLGVRGRAEEEAAFPAADVPRPLAGEEEDQESAFSRKVLIINHDPGTVRVLRYFLEKEDFEVLSCSGGADGLKEAVQNRPDIILLDLLLPGMDGYQVLGRLKKDNKTARIPVFVLSMLAQESDVLKAIEGGAADYFVKPFSPQIIIAKIRRTLKARHG